MLEGKAEGLGDTPRLFDGSGASCLREIDELALVTKIFACKLRMPIEAERPHHQALKMSQQKVGQVEGSELGLAELREQLRCRVELVAVRPWQPLDAFFLQHCIELTPGAAIAIGDEDPTIPAAILADGLTHCRRDALGTVMQRGRQAAHLERAPAVGTLERGDLARECAAGDDERGRCGAQGSAAPQAAVAAEATLPVARRLASSDFAVSTATAASRQ